MNVTDYHDIDWFHFGDVCFSNRDSGYGSWRSDRSDKKDAEGPTTPGVMSNNRRWMLYKMTKQSTDDLLEPSTPVKEKPVVTQDLNSRIDQLSNTSQPTQAEETIPNKLDISSKHSPLINNNSLVSPQNGDIGSGNIAALRDKLANNKLAGGMMAGHGGQQAPPATTSQTQQVSDLDNRWEGIERSARRRELRINDLDFTDLRDIDDIDILCAPSPQFGAGGVPPPPPMGGPPPPPMGGPPMPPPPMMPAPPPPPMGAAPAPPNKGLKKTEDVNSRAKKTLRLHWREVQDKVIVPNPTADIKNKGTIWSKIKPTTIDATKFEHLFETRVVDTKAKVGDVLLFGKGLLGAIVCL